MNYVLELLESRLREELIARETAVHCLKGNGFHMHRATQEAFIESSRLADERIPQLEKTLELIKINTKA